MMSLDALEPQSIEEKTLAAECQRLAQILEGSGLGTWEWNVQTGAARFNERWAATIGARLLELEPVDYGTWRSRVHPEDLERSRELLERHVAGASERYECEMRMRHSSGTWVWVVVRGAVVTRTEDGRPEWICGTQADISSSKTQALLEANERLVKATDSGGIGIWNWDINANTLVWDSWMYRLYGIEDSEKDVKTYDLWSRHLHPEDRAATEKALQDGVAGIKPYQAEFRIIWADGSIHYLRGTGRVIRDAAGRPLRMVGANWNVTHLHELLGELEEQRQWLEVTLHSIGDGVITTDAEGRVLRLNRVAENLTGWQTAEACGKHLTDVFCLQDGNGAQELLRACIQRGQRTGPNNYKILLSRSGQAFHIEDSGAPIFNAGGTILGMVLVFHDVTAQRRALESLQASEGLFNVLVEKSPALTYIKDRDGHMVYMNAVCRKMWNFDGVDWLGKSDAELWSPELAKGFRELDLQVLDSNAGGLNLDVVPLPDGGVCSLLSHKFPLELPSGERLIGGVSIDISEQKEAEQRLMRALAEKGVLLKEVHHRVRNNLQVISSMLRMQGQFLQDAGAIAALDLGRQRVLSMAMIHERVYNSEQMSHLEFSDYLKSLVDQLVHAYSPTGKIVPVVEAAPVLLGIDQAVPCGLISNELVTNALRHAYPGGHSGKIKVQLAEDERRYVRLTVADEGAGLPEGFDWKKSKSMGLSIVDILTKQLDGEWWISDGQPGAQFVVEFLNEFSQEVES